MCKKCTGAQPLDTLAQLGTQNHNTSENEDIIVLDKRTKVGDKRKLQNRAKRKHLSEALSLGLVKVTEIKHEKILEKVKKEGWTDQNLADFNENVQARKSYWNMYHCAGELIKEGDEIKGKYCKNRTCLICNSIRTAQNLNTYKPVIDAWSDDMYMVTLTIPNCSEDLLKPSIDGMFNIFTQIKDTLRKRHQRGKGVKFEGLRKFECTYNPHRDDYHPHFHILVKGEEGAKELLNQWLNRTQHLGTKRIAQDIRKADKNAALELFKYFTKVMTSTSKTGGERAIYLDAMDNIFKAVKGKRTFQTFGFVVADYVEEEAESEQEEEEANQETDHTPESFVWRKEQADWISTSTGEILACHELSESLTDITNKMFFKSKERFTKQEKTKNWGCYRKERKQVPH